MPTVNEIAAQFANLGNIIASRKDEAFTQAATAFLAHAVDMRQVDKEKVELPLQQRLTPQVWEIIRQALPEFETHSGLTIYSSKLMTVDRAKKLAADASKAK